MTSTDDSPEDARPEGEQDPVGASDEPLQKRIENVVNARTDDEYVDPVHCEATKLMTAVQAGDPDAFDDLVVRFRGRAYRIARALVGSRDDAMELSQEAFLKVFRARETYNPSQPFLPWFHRILRNTCFSFLRKHKRIQKRSLTFAGDDGEETDYEIVDPTPGPADDVLQDERARLFHTAMQRLSARDREILALRHFKEMAYKEIALTLGIPEGTVMSRLFHARRRLKDALGPTLSELLSESSAVSQGGQ